MYKPGDQQSKKETLANQASKWVWKVDQGLSASEQDEFMNWLGADQRHGIAYRAYAKDFKEFDQLIDWQPIHGASPNPDLFAPRESKLRRSFPTFMGIAATIAFIAGILFFRTGDDTAKSIDIALSGGEMTLADNSIIHYNDGAEFEVDYSASERRIILKSGEAYFGVEKDPNRPFVVEAEGLELIAVGTAFNVRLGEETMEVFIEEGIVEMSGPDLSGTWSDPAENTAISSRHLNQFTKTVVFLERQEQSPTLDSISESDLKKELSWQHRMLVFDGDTLMEVISEFNRLNNSQFILEDSSLEDFQISGTINSNNVMGLCRLLEVSFGISNQLLDSERILLLQE